MMALLLRGAAALWPAAANLLAGGAGRRSLSAPLSGWMCGALRGLSRILKTEAPKPRSGLGPSHNRVVPLFEPLHSSAHVYLLHYLVPIIQVYRTNKAICPVSTSPLGGLQRTAPSHPSHVSDVHHQGSRLHCLCTPARMVNTAVLSKLPSWAHLSDRPPAFPPTSPFASVCGVQTSSIHAEGKKIITLNHFGCCESRSGQAS